MLIGTLPYDIVLLPDQKIQEKAIRLSELLARTYSSRFTLGKQTNFPHYSIYMAQLDAKNLEAAKEKLQAIAAGLHPFHLEATQYWQDPEEGFFEIQYQRTQRLIKLQEQILKQISHLREGKFLASYPPGYTKAELEKRLSGNALEQLNKHGYPEIDGDYRPHMTFMRLPAEEIKTTIDTKILPPITDWSGIFSTLGLYQMGENGTCIKKVADFFLR